MRDKFLYFVIGAGFGDEGKGKVTDFLCSELSNPLVIRYSGGQQAGHHVITEDGKDHVFSNFGSGTLRGVPSYWSPYCTCDPEGILNEYKILKDKGVQPNLFLDPKCPVTTPFDKIYNRELDRRNGHGTVGVGVGATLEREENFYSLLVEDLEFPEILKIKLQHIYYYYLTNSIFKEGIVYKYNDEDFESIFERFLKCCEELIENVYIERKIPPLKNHGSLIFEGSQGLLLDPNIGFFPHVTRTDVGMKGALKTIKRLEIGDQYVTTIYVSRAYQTRHGNGPMTNEKNTSFNIKENPYEQNKTHLYQGEFKKSMLDLDLLQYAILKDGSHRFNKNNFFNTVFTCFDCLEDYKFSYKNKIHEFDTKEKFLNEISCILNIKGEILYSKSPVSEKLEKFDLS